MRAAIFLLLAPVLLAPVLLAPVLLTTPAVADPPRSGVSNGLSWGRGVPNQPTYQPRNTTNFPRYGAFAYEGGRNYSYSRPHHGYHNNFHTGFPHGYSFGTPIFGGYGYGYSSFHGGISPYGTYYVPSANYVEYNLPPVYYPAELNYGPQAMKQFMGVDRNFALGPLLDPPANIVDPPLVLRPEVQPEPAVRQSNTQTIALAVKQETAGDALFAEQNYHEALQRYKAAAEIAPDYAVAYLKQALALIATRRYDLAMAALERGNHSNDLGSVDLKLDNLYGDNQIAKRAHLESLAQAVLDDPQNAQNMFLLAMFLKYDGQAERAQKFFAAAQKLAGS